MLLSSVAFHTVCVKDSFAGTLVLTPDQILIRSEVWNRDRYTSSSLLLKLSAGCCRCYFEKREERSFEINSLVLIQAKGYSITSHTHHTENIGPRKLNLLLFSTYS